MADHYDRGLVVGEHFVYAALALFLKLEVAHGKYLVNYKYIRYRHCGNCKAYTRHHTG